MSGTEFVAVAAVASSIIAIVDGIAKVFQAACDTEGLPKEFRRASQKLEIISDILDATKTALEENKGQGVDLSAVKKTVDRCQEDWTTLKQLFEKVIPEDKTSRRERYIRAARTLGKGSKVETLMKNLLQNIQLLTNFKIMTERGVEQPVASAADRKKLDKHIADVSSWEPSLPDSVFEEKGGHNINISGGSNINVMGHGQGARQNNLENQSQYYEIQGDYHAGKASPHKLDQVGQACLQTLNCPDTFAIKNQLKRTKDKLVKGSMNWILKDPQFVRWRDGDDLSLLWIKGGAGKGKTMTSIGLIEELSRTNGEVIVAYAFCQDADYELSTVESIIKGIMLSFINQKRETVEILGARWDIGKQCFTKATPGAPFWQTLWDTFWNILLQSKCPRVYLIVDALDECRESEMADFLQNLVRTGLDCPEKIKWLLTSRPLDSASKILLSGSNETLVSLELNDEHVSAGIATYTSEKVAELDKLHNYGPTLHQQVVKELTEKAGGIYMWVSLVCKNLRRANRDKALSTIQDSPRGLHPFYNRALKQISSGEPKIVEDCIRLLSAVALAFRPLNPWEMESISGLDFSSEGITLEMLLDRCTSFIRVRKGTARIELVHQSAREFLSHKDAQSIFESIGVYGHGEIVLNLVSHLSRNLKSNIANLPRFATPGIQVGLGYRPGQKRVQGKLKDRGEKNQGLNKEPFFLKFLLDIKSFLGSEAVRPSALQCTPLQIYAKAMAFAPGDSVLRGENLDKALTGLSAPLQLDYMPALETASLALSQKGIRSRRRQRPDVPVQHSQPLAFSLNLKQIASVNQGNKRTITLWSSTTGELQGMIEHSHKFPVSALVYSPDGKLIASSSFVDIKLWDTRTGKLQRPVIHRSKKHYIQKMEISPDGKKMLSISSHPSTASRGDYGWRCQIWDLTTKAPPKTIGRLRDNGGKHIDIATAAFSSDSKYVVSGSHDGRVIIWDVASGKCQSEQWSDLVSRTSKEPVEIAAPQACTL
ncbi:hypothetical protein TWF481_006351 [Arthrobotrys musiformis]|uniref:NACHT domain-containing protein n=1 Tax=Arthrobotrys musiformis TaxID=47236 RepID=A0AAV9WHF5_9PEZI